MKSQLLNYFRLMRFHKPIGSFLLLWPTLWALWIAYQGIPPWNILVIFIVGTFITRSAGCVINDIADRNFDGFVERTRDRPMACKKINLSSAIILFLILILMAFILVLQLNRQCFYLSLVGLLLMVIYPFCKRITHLSQFVLGMAFAMSIPMAFAAAEKTWQLPGFLLYVSGVLWPVMYDTEYAMSDRNEDVKIGLKSTAILLKHYDLIFIIVCQLILLSLWLSIGLYYRFSFFYFLMLLLGAANFIYQYYLIRSRLPVACFKAFLNNAWIGLFIFMGILAGS